METERVGGAGQECRWSQQLPRPGTNNLLVMHVLSMILLLPLLLHSVLGQAPVDTIEKVCGVQYEPNNVITTQLEYVNFYTSPLFYDPTGTLNPDYGFTVLSPYLFPVVVNNTIQATSDAEGVIVSNTLYPVPQENGGLQVKATLNFQADLVSGVVTSPLGFDEDPFYASGVFGMISYASIQAWTMAFLITNTKVYALFQANDGIGLNIFRYVIPVGNRTPEDYATYSVTLESNFAVSWRINDREVLRIASPSQAVDPRFDTGLGRTIANAQLPPFMQMIVGNFKLTPLVNILDPSNIPDTACQRTLFSLCRQSLRNAFGSNCQYAPLTSYTNAPDFDMLMTIDELSAASYVRVPGCIPDPNCKPEPVRCPRVRPERMPKPVNPIPVPTGTTMTRTTTATSTSSKPTSTTRVPCACRPARPTISIAGLVYRP